MYQHIQAYPYQYPGVLPVSAQPPKPSDNVPPLQSLSPIVTPTPSSANPPAASADKPKSSGLHVFEFLHIGVMSLIGSLFMSSITHTKYSKVLPVNLLVNTAEALAVSALYKGKVPSINRQLNKIGTQPQNQATEPSTQEKKPYLPYIVSLINATSCLILTTIYMLQGKMKDKSITSVSNQALQEGFRTFIKGIQKQPGQIVKQLSRFMQLLGTYVTGLPFFRFMNRNPVLAVALPVATAAYTGLMEGKAATRIANKASGRILNPLNGQIQNNQRVQL